MVYVALQVLLCPEIIYVFYEEHSLDYWEAILSPRSREFIGCSFWEVWQVQHEQKKVEAAQNLKTNRSQAYIEERIESIIAQADKNKPSSTSSKKQRLTNLRENKQAEKDIERLKQRNNSQKSSKSALTVLEHPESSSKTENNILHMPKSKQFINLEDDEDYRLRFGVYQDLLDDLEDSNDEN